MKLMTLRDSLCCLMVFLFPLSLMAAEPGAMVYVSGSASVNGALVPHSSAVFPGDTVQTTSSSQANLTAAGVSVTVFANSSIKFESYGVSINDGSADVGTSKKDMAVKAGIVTVTPASGAWTEFQMSHRNGAVQIVARKGDVNVTSGAETVTLAQGQSDTRDDSPASTDADNGKRKKRDEGPAPALSTPVFDSPLLIGLGAAGIAGGLAYVLLRGESPVSPSVP